MPLLLFQSPHQCLEPLTSKVSTVGFSVSLGEPDLKQPLASRCDNCITSGGDSCWDSPMEGCYHQAGAKRGRTEV